MKKYIVLATAFFRAVAQHFYAKVLERGSLAQEQIGELTKRATVIPSAIGIAKTNDPCIFRAPPLFKHYTDR